MIQSLQVSPIVHSWVSNHQSTLFKFEWEYFKCTL